MEANNTHDLEDLEKGESVVLDLSQFENLTLAEMDKKISDAEGCPDCDDLQVRALSEAMFKLTTRKRNTVLMTKWLQDSAKVNKKITEEDAEAKKEELDISADEFDYILSTIIDNNYVDIKFVSTIMGPAGLGELSSKCREKNELLATQLAKSEDLVGKYKKAFQKTKDKYDNKKEEFKSASKELEEKVVENGKLLNQISSLENEKDKYKQLFQKRRYSAHSLFEKIKLKRNAFEKQIVDLSKSIEEKDHEIQSLKSDAVFNKGEIEKKQTEINELNEALKQALADEKKEPKKVSVEVKSNKKSGIIKIAAVFITILALASVAVVYMDEISSFFNTSTIKKEGDSLLNSDITPAVDIAEVENVSSPIKNNTQTDQTPIETTVKSKGDVFLQGAELDTNLPETNNNPILLDDNKQENTVVLEPANKENDNISLADPSNKKFDETKLKEYAKSFIVKKDSFVFLNKSYAKGQSFGEYKILHISEGKKVIYFFNPHTNSTIVVTAG